MITEKKNNAQVLRKFYNDLIINDDEPLICFNTKDESYKGNIPQQYLQANGEIVLNLSRKASRNLEINDQTIRFLISFNGAICEVVAGIDSILWIGPQYGSTEENCCISNEICTLLDKFAKGGDLCK
jgi:stringent starvation protein B